MTDARRRSGAMGMEQPSRRDGPRRAIGVVLALVALGTSYAITSRLKLSEMAEARGELDTQVRASLNATRAGLEKLEQHLTNTGKTAADSKGLEAQVQAGANASTFADFVTTEEGWEPYRKLALSAVLISGKPVAMTGDPAMLEAGRPVVDDATATGASGAWAPVKGVPVRLAATRLKAQTPNGLPVVVLLGESLTPAGLARTSDGSAGLAINAGGLPLIAGTDAQKVLMTLLIGNPETTQAVPASVELGKGVTLIAAIDGTARFARVDEEARRLSVVVFSLGGLLALAALAFGFWPRKPSEAALLHETTMQLMRQQDELSKVAARLSNPGVQTGSIDPAALALGETVRVHSNRYQTLAPLGEGGMAKVTVAALKGEQGFKRLYVLKRLKAELTTSTEAVAQFIDEARLGASLVHSNIVPVFDFGRDEQGYYLAQEYIHGRNLDYISEESKALLRRPLTAPMVLYVAQEVLRALEYAHAKRDDQNRPLNLVHRDVSPNNLIVSERGEVKLLDFGIVKSDQRIAKTQPGVVKGNLFYMSPEQAKGGQVDARADLFSLGMVMYVLASGALLYGGATGYDVLSRAAMGPVDEDWELIRKLGSPLAMIIERALQTEPKDRFQSASEFAAVVAASGRVAPASALADLVKQVCGTELAAETARLSGHLVSA